MSEIVVKHELFEYIAMEPFKLINLENEEIDSSRILNHWHKELEMAYYYNGEATHYINGEKVEGKKGRLIVTNSEFIHNIIPSEKPEKHVFIIIIHPEFLKANFPEYDQYYFTNNKEQASPHIKNVINKLLEYHCKENKTKNDHLLAKSLILKLLYYVANEGLVRRDEVDDINVLKDIERIKGIIQFIENHYTEHITQSYVAKKFYFNKAYFSRYFKKCTGITFTEYLTKYRLLKAKKELLNSDKSVTEIALENGFSDDRRFIIAFKKMYGTTPLQYKKRKK